MDGKTTHYQRSKEIILNWAKGYYEKNKGRLKNQAKNKYRESPNEEKEIKIEYGEIDIEICLKKINRD